MVRSVSTGQSILTLSDHAMKLNVIVKSALVLCTFLLVVNKCLIRGNLRMLACSSREYTKLWREGMATGMGGTEHIAPTVRRQREINATPQFAFPYFSAQNPRTCRDAMNVQSMSSHLNLIYKHIYKHAQSCVFPGVFFKLIAKMSYYRSQNV